MRLSTLHSSLQKRITNSEQPSNRRTMGFMANGLILPNIREIIVQIIEIIVCQRDSLSLPLNIYLKTAFRKIKHKHVVDVRTKITV